MTHFIGRGGKCYACLDFYSTYYYNRNVFEAFESVSKNSAPLLESVKRIFIFTYSITIMQ